MHYIFMSEVTQGFARGWQAAGMHIERMAGGRLIDWLRAHLNPPFLEHLSFRLGNQLCSLRIEDGDSQIEGPGSLEGLPTVADGCKAHACLIPMLKRGGQGQAALRGWGLQDARTKKLFYPPAEINEQKIDMTDWELQDFAVHVVRELIEKEGYELKSWHANPGVDSLLWFVGNNGPQWVIVRTARYTQEDAELPGNWRIVADSCSRMRKPGNFASVPVACMQTISKGGRLYRGYLLVTNYAGVQSIRKMGRAA